jgi:hypothetical protein
MTRTDHDRLARLRDRLDAVGYTAAGVDQHRQGDLDPDEPLAVLIRLFSLGQRIPDRSARQALSPVPLEGCAALGLLRHEGESVSPVLRLVPHEGLLLALEPPEREGDDDPLRVMAPSGSTLTMARVMHRTPRESALDLGTGCGLLALLAAGHSRRVVATDHNPRAVSLTELSAGLNRRPNVETRIGDWFEPVAGERFDQAICNPPYVISPDTRLLYRDSGLEGDAVSELVVRTLPRHLKPGGVGQVLINWIIRDGEDWRERMDGWYADSGCDVFLQQLDTFDAADYARHWLGERADGLAFDAWMAYYRRLRITAIGTGVLTLTRGEGVR